MKEAFNREAIKSDAAADMAFTPAQGILSTTIQGAIEEAVKKITIPIKEENTSAITKGQVLCVTGASGEKVQVGLCASTDSNKIRVIGLLHADIVQNASGIAVYKGELSGVDSRATNLDINPNGETWSAGAMLWVSNTAGGMTHNRPAHGRSIKAAISRKGSCDDDILQVISHENPINVMAASGEDIIFGMGDSAGINKAIGKNYAGTDVFSFDSNGCLVSKMKEIIQATSDTLTVLEVSNTQINNYGQGAVNNLQTFPTAAKGMSCVGMIGTAQAAHYFRFQAAANDKIYLDGVAGSDNGYVEIAAPIVGATIQFFTFQTGASIWDWAANSINGSWIAG